MAGRGRKSSEKIPQNWFFGSIFSNFQDYIKSRNICDTLFCTALLVKVLYKLDLIWACNLPKTTQKQPKIPLFAGTTKFGLVIYPKLPKSSQKSHFLLVRQTLKIYNLTTTNAILMKLTRIVYLHETFHLPKYWGLTHTEKESVVQKLLKTNHKMRFLG